MILSGDLANHFTGLLDRPIGTVLHRGQALRAADMLSTNGRGPRAAAHMTSTDAVSWLLALILDHGRGEDIAENVRAVRALPAEGPIAVPNDFGQTLQTLNAPNAGAALDSLLDDMRSLRFAMFAGSDRCKIGATIESRGHSAIITISKDERREHALAGFAQPGYDQARRLVEQHTTISGTVFSQLADMLGPLTKP